VKDQQAVKRKSESSKQSPLKTRSKDSNMPVLFNFMGFNRDYESMRFKLNHCQKKLEKASYTSQSNDRQAVLQKLHNNRMDEWNNIPLPIIGLLK
jgi:hypothetical protein